MKYTEKEIEFLKENYPKYGGSYCRPFLKDRSIDAINAMAIRLKLSAKNKVVHPILQKISISNFLNIKNKEVAYFLGYFWADGNIINYKSNNITHWRISLEIQSEDATNIYKILEFLGKWSIQKRKRNISWKETTTFVTNNKELYIFLKENDFDLKSNVEPTKILNLIPDELKNYFWKGFLDGDGSAGLIVNKNPFIEFSATYKYMWKEVSNLCNKLGIEKYYIYNNINKQNQKNSKFKINGKYTLSLVKYFPLYGLDRKNNKLKTILNKYDNTTDNTKRLL